MRDDADGFREADVLDFGNEGEDVSRSLATEAMEELADGVDGERWGFFLVEGAESGVVLRAGFAQAYVAFDHLDDVGLLLDGLFKVGHGYVLRIRREPDVLVEEAMNNGKSDPQAVAV